ncbi:pantothenate kinase 1-like [Zophobas morio]|uniref:pantothenate kinase 1-like n=1 Tax=Zophobas morio TaxID=2755281 RepID=UPI003082F900
MDVKNTKRVFLGFDMGGTLAKLVYAEKDTVFCKESLDILNFILSTSHYGSSGIRDSHLEVSIPELGKVYFIRFASNRISGAIDLIKKKNLHIGIEILYAVGGGTHKYKALFEKELGVKIVHLDELGSIVKGMVYLLQHVEDECYTIENVANEDGSTIKINKNFGTDNDLFPFLVVNIGTGVSILKVTKANDIERISGTALGGGTFLGLCRLLTNSKKFDEALDLAATGDANSVNMLVKDIYSGECKGLGSDIKHFNLSGDLTASFFAKNIMISNPNENIRKKVSDSDISRALCIMIAQNVTQIALLNAKLHNVFKVFFTGNFLRHNPIASRTIVQNMRRWSELGNLNIEILFFRREGYLGAFGALIQGIERLK